MIIVYNYRFGGITDHVRMRRSTAPSFLSKAKRPRFSTPWATQDNVQNSTPINTVSNVATSHSQAVSIFANSIYI